MGSSNCHCQAALLKQAPGRLCLLALQPVSQTGVAAQVTQMTAGLLFAVAVRSNVGKANVNPQGAFNFYPFWRFNLAGGEQVEFPINIA